MDSVHTINLKSSAKSMNSLHTAYIYSYQDLVVMDSRVSFPNKKPGKHFPGDGADAFADQHMSSVQHCHLQLPEGRL